MKYRKQSNCVYACEYHVVITTKYRRKIIVPGVYGSIKKNIKEIEEHYPEIEVLEMNHDKDHVHLLVSIPPKMRVGDVVRIIKSNTARKMNEKFKFLRKVYFGTRAVWSEGYFVSTLGINESVIRKYIEMQGKEDLAQTKFELN